jgi:hypothetical protein
MSAVVRVGDGRGFVVRHAGKRLVLTAAHCLPRDADGNVRMPPPHPCSYLGERTYTVLLGPLGAETTVWAECLFVNPIADIAILGCPDEQELSREAEAYEAFVGRCKPLPIADAPKMGRERVEIPNYIPDGQFGRSYMIDTPGRGAARVLTLAGEWTACTVARRGTWLAVEDEALVKSGMSGSPVVDAAGRAIALMSNEALSPVLRDNLPSWFFRRAARAARDLELCRHKSSGSLSQK